MKFIFFANTDWYLYNYRVPIDNLLRKKGYEIVMVSPPGNYCSKIMEAGFRWTPLRMSRSGLNLFEEINTIRQLVWIYKDEKPDIVHHFTIKSNFYGAIAAKIANVPYVVNSIAGLGYVFDSPSLKARLLKPFGYLGYKFSLMNSKVIFQNSDDLFNFVANGYVERDDAYLIKSSGVELNKFVPGPFSDTHLNVLLGSRMLWTKGIEEFVQAAQLLREKYPHVNFLLAGDVDPGNPASIPKKQLLKWEESGNVTWLGFQDNMADLINKCHIICFPSKHSEGTPKFLVEAAACGRPIITTDNRGCKEVVIDGENGYLVPKGDYKALAAAIAKLISNPELIESMGRMSRIIAEQEFALESVVEKTQWVYNAAMARSAVQYEPA